MRSQMLVIAFSIASFGICLFPFSGLTDVLYRSSIVQPSAAAIAGSLSAGGYDFPDSHAATAVRHTPTLAASSACVSPAALRAIMIPCIAILPFSGQAGTLYRSSIVQLSAAAIAGSISARGYDPLVSHIATVLCPTCSADASSACVKPRFARQILMPSKVSPPLINYLDCIYYLISSMLICQYIFSIILILRLLFDFYQLS